MTDAVTEASSKTKIPTKASKTGAAEAAGDNKKRFEVKKVRLDDMRSSS